MKVCKHCGAQIKWVEDYIWIHTGRGPTLTADRCLDAATFAAPADDRPADT